MRGRTRLTPSEWQARLDREMERVLRDPANFPPATVQWARWRREWLAESGSLFREPAERAEVVDAEGLTGPSCGPARAGETVCTRELAAGGENRPKTPENAATFSESTTSARSSLSPASDNLGARGGGNGAAGRGRRRWSGEKTFASQIVLW